MNDYFIGSGAIITSGPRASIAEVALHAQTDTALAAVVKAAVVDFEGSAARGLGRLVLAGAGWRRERAAREVIEPLLDRGACSLADVLATLGSACGGAEVHLFARWLPDEGTVDDLRARGLTLVAHPLEEIRQAALVCGQRFERWSSGMRAA
jgi:hypothetical protein